MLPPPSEYALAEVFVEDDTGKDFAALDFENDEDSAVAPSPPLEPSLSDEE